MITILYKSLFLFSFNNSLLFVKKSRIKRLLYHFKVYYQINFKTKKKAIRN